MERTYRLRNERKLMARWAIAARSGQAHFAANIAHVTHIAYPARVVALLGTKLLTNMPTKARHAMAISATLRPGPRVKAIGNTLFLSLGIKQCHITAEFRGRSPAVQHAGAHRAKVSTTHVRPRPSTLSVTDPC